MGVLEIAFYLILFIILVIDIKSKSIYDLNLLAALVPVLFIIWEKDWWYHLLGAFVGFLIGYTIYSIALWYYEAEAFGFGDVLLLVLIGLYLGWVDFLCYFAVTNMVAGFIGLILVLLTRGRLLKYEMPMAPYFVLGVYAFDFFERPDIYVCLDYFAKFIN